MRSHGARLLPSGLGSILTLLAFLGAPSGAAHASPTYPGALQTELEMACAPPCTICHRDLAGGFGTVEKPFGRAMLAAGLPAASPDRLADALADLRAEGKDSDGDGDPDVEELESGADPNGDGVLCGPTYGCGARVAPAEGSFEGILASAAVLLALAAGARTSRSSRTEPRRGT